MHQNLSQYSSMSGNYGHQLDYKFLRFFQSMQKLASQIQIWRWNFNLVFSSTCCTILHFWSLTSFLLSNFCTSQLYYTSAYMYLIVDLHLSSGTKSAVSITWFSTESQLINKYWHRIHKSYQIERFIISIFCFFWIYNIYQRILLWYQAFGYVPYRLYIYL